MIVAISSWKNLFPVLIDDALPRRDLTRVRVSARMKLELIKGILLVS